MHIDGEFFKLKNPDGIVISLAKDFPNGKIKMLFRNKKTKKGIILIILY